MKPGKLKFFGGGGCGRVLALVVACGWLVSCTDHPDQPDRPEQTGAPTNLSVIRSNLFDRIPGATEEEKDRNLREEQLEVLSRLCALFPEDDNAVYLTGLVFQEQGNTAEAIQHFERCLELDPNRPDTCESLGKAVFLRGQYARAAELFQRALGLNPELDSARLQLAQCYKNMGKPEQVVSTLKEGAGQDPRALCLLGQAYLQLQDCTNAAPFFLAALKRKPDLAEAHYGLVAACLGLGDSEKAAQHRETFRQLKAQGQQEGRDWRRIFSPLAVTCQSVAHTHTDVGRVYLSQKQFAAAEKLFSRAIVLNPTNEVAYSCLVSVYQQTRRPQKALQLLEQLIPLNPNKGLYYFQMGHLQQHLRRFQEAENAFRKVIELEPDRPDGYASLAQLLTQTNRRQEALQSIQRAIRLDPSNSAYQQIYHRLLKQE